MAHLWKLAPLTITIASLVAACGGGGDETTTSEAGADERRPTTTAAERACDPDDGLAPTAASVLVVLDASTGRTCWIVELPPRGYLHPVAVTPELVIGMQGACGTEDGGRAQLVAFDRTGERAWTGPSPVLPDERERVVDAADGTLVVRSEPGDVIAVDIRSGEERWRAPGGSADDTGDAVVVRRSDGTIVALERDDGAERWTYAPDDRAAPTTAGDVVLVTSATGAVALDASDGSELWRAPIVPGSDVHVVRSEAGVATGFRATDDAFVGVDLASGAEAWTLPGLRPSQGATPTDGVVFASAVDGELVAVDARTGAVLWRADASNGGGGPAGSGLVMIGESAHDAQTGEVRWTMQAQEWPETLASTGILVDDGVVAIGLQGCGWG